MRENDVVDAFYVRLLYLINLFAFRERFTCILFVLILFYKTRLSRLNLIILSSSSNIFIFLSSSIESILFLSSLLFLASNIESLKNSLKNINKFIKFFFNEKFVKKSEEKKKDKEKKEEENVEKNNNKNKEFSYN